MKIFGLDLSLTSTGWAIVNDGVVEKYGTIKTTNKHTFLERLEIIKDKILNIIHDDSKHSERPIDFVAIEDTYVNRRNFKVSIQLAKLNGAVVGTLFLTHDPTTIFIYDNKKIKEAVTDYGGAGKDQMVRVINKFTNYKGKSDDIADAIAVALTCESSYKYDQKIKKQVDMMFEKSN